MGDDGSDTTSTDFMNTSGSRRRIIPRSVQDLPADGKQVVDVRAYLTATESSGTGTSLATANWYDTERRVATLT